MQERSSDSRFGFRALSLRSRLGFGMAALVLPLLLISASGYLLFRFAIESIEESHEEIRDEMLPVFRLQELILQAKMPSNDYLILGNSQEREKFEHLSTEIAGAFKKALSAPFDRHEKYTILTRAQALWLDGERMSRMILALPDPQGNAKGAELMVQMDAVMQSASEHLGAISVLVLGELDHQHGVVHKLHVWVGVAIVVFLSILSVAVFAGMIFVRRWITAPLAELEAGAQQFAIGNLEHRIPIKSSDEIGSVAQTFNEMAHALQRDHEILRNLSIHDQLTGLLNRKEFQRLLDLEIARSLRYGRELALLMIDVDRFKVINDSYGHPAGDIVLRNIADRILSSLRPNDVVARYGGEEFIVLLPETDGVGSVAIAERLCAHVRELPVEITQNIRPIVTVSVGIAMYPHDATAAADLTSMADKALYAAKNAGRDRCCLYAGLPAADVP